MATLFEAYVTNAGKYSEGQLVGETLKFPTTAQEVEALLKRIGVDGVRYQEIFITSFDGDVLGLYDHLSEYENLDELNHLACLLSELTSSELETLEAVLDSGDHCSSVRDIINLTQNLDCYGFYPGVSDEETLGRIYVDDLEMLDVPDQVKPYFDYEAYGRDACIHENGHFAPGGYIVKESDHFLEVYHGLQDIPKEHKVFSFPKLSIREQMAAYCGATMPGAVHKTAEAFSYGAEIQGGKDPWFGLELWFLTSFQGKPVWAINQEHLAYLIDYLSADLREKPSGSQKKTQADHLPTFMKTAKNRERIVKLLKKLQEK